MATVGLYFYGSRWFDPYLNRWLQPDSIIPDPHNPLDLDRYSYVRNNPINYNDPTGHDPCTNGSYQSFCPPSNTTERAPYTLLQLIQSDQSTPWEELDAEQKYTLASVGWDSQSFNNSDFVIPGIKDIAGTMQDPVVLLLAMVSVGKLGPSAIAMAKQLISSSSIVNLYRAVGAGELADILKNGIFRPDPNGLSMSGKWFTNSPVLAQQWGQRFSNWTGEAFTVIEVGVPQSVVKLMQNNANLDGIGPAWYAEGHVLDMLNQLLRYINVIN